MYYFAYGSNMNHEQMKKRCPSSKFLKRVYLKGYKFVYDGYSKNRDGAVANIIEAGRDSDIVWGGLFEINEDNLAALDCYEGYYKKFYDKKIITVKDEDSRDRKVWVYFRIGQKEGEPSKKYRDIVMQGAKDCNLSEGYIRGNLLGEKNGKK